MSDTETTGNSSQNRTRTESECSLTEPETASNSGPKRQRTVSLNCASVAASPPKFVSFEEIVHAANNLRDMSLIHQIVLDDNFKIDESAATSVSSPAGQVKEVIKKAFWDVVRENLSKDPPDYAQGLVLLEDIKQALFSLILPQHTKIHREISEKLDSDLIKQQAINNTLDFKHYTDYIIETMGKLCSPARDEKIKELLQLIDIVDIFKGILETLDLMKIDMANFIIEVTKPELMATSTEWERKKFAEVLAVQPNGLRNTTNWLVAHIDKYKDRDPSDPLQLRQTVSTVLSEAYVALLVWDEEKFDDFPETLIFDRDKLIDLQIRFQKISLIGTILLIVSNLISFDSKILLEFKENLKDKIGILLDSAKTKNEIDGMINEIADFVIEEIVKKFNELEIRNLSDENKTLLKLQICEIKQPSHRIRQLVVTRLKEFLLQVITSSTAAPQKVPIGLSTMQKEIAQISGQFLRIVSRNRTVYAEYYLDIVEKQLKQN